MAILKSPTPFFATRSTQFCAPWPPFDALFAPPSREPKTAGGRAGVLRNRESRRALHQLSILTGMAILKSAKPFFATRSTQLCASWPPFDALFAPPSREPKTAGGRAGVLRKPRISPLTASVVNPHGYGYFEKRYTIFLLPVQHNSVHRGHPSTRYLHLPSANARQ